MPKRRPTRLAVSAGDPCGVGPELLDRLVHSGLGAHLVVFGDATLSRIAGRDIEVIGVSCLSPADRVPGRPTPEGGRAQLAYLSAAVAAVEAGEAEGLVTLPVSKEGIVRATGAEFQGHTEWLAARAGLGPADVAMTFVGDGLVVGLATTHLPLAAVPGALRSERLVRVASLLATYLGRVCGHARPRILFAALNPHAGEGGLFGKEEKDVIAPAVETARRVLSCEVEGPVPADAVFRIARQQSGTAVVALYHDQATIAVKLLGVGASVNVTLGLPYLRTSVDHGVAYDIAGKGIADPAGVILAVELARDVASKARRIDWTSSPNRINSADPEKG